MVSPCLVGIDNHVAVVLKINQRYSSVLYLICSAHSVLRPQALIPTEGILLFSLVLKKYKEIFFLLGVSHVIVAIINVFKASIKLT